MYVKINFRNSTGDELFFVNRKIEYFFDVWSAIFDNFLKEELHIGLRFESHRSLISKMEDQIEYNRDYACKNLVYYANASIFDQNRIISKARPVKLRVQKLRSLTKKGCSIHECKKILDGLKNFLFKKHNYSNLLCGDLYKILNNNSRFNNSDKADLQLLANCLVSELYHAGYSMSSIRNMPHILLLRSDINRFPWDKSINDFESEDDYGQYCQGRFLSFNLHTLVRGIYNFINQNLEKGYILFKIDGLILEQPPEIKIGDVLFYNPRNDQKVVKGNWRNNDYLSKVELFVYGNDSDRASSGCNALVPIKFRKRKSDRRSVDVIRAYRKVAQALPYLSYISDKYSKGRQVFPSVNFSQHIFLSREMTPPEVSLGSLIDEEINLAIDDKDKLKEYEALQKFFLESLNYDNPSHRIVMDLFLEVRKQDSYVWYFDFGQLWSCWEALFKEYKGETKFDSIQSFLIHSYHKNIDRRYIDKALWSMRSSLQRQEILSEQHYYFLDDAELNLLGLSDQLNIKKFEKNAQAVLGRHRSQMVQDESEVVLSYLRSRQTFFNELDRWIKYSTKEVYLARNLKFHARHDNDFTYGKLKNDFLWISLKGIIEISREVKKYKNRDVYSFVNR